MAFPYLSQNSFEGGAIGYDSETDTDVKLAVEHFTRLARQRLAPYRGAYAMHIDLSKGTNDAYLEETDDFDTSADGTIHVRFYFWASGLTMAASDRFTIFALQSGAGTDEVVVDVRNNAGVIEILASETGAGSTVRATLLAQSAWHCVEIAANIDAGGGNDGTVDFYLDGVQVGAQITALDQAVITQARIGAIGIDAGTTAGHLLFDSVIADDARVFPNPERFPRQVTMTQSGHVFVGPGAIDSATLLTTGTSNTMYLYDTDVANTDQAAARVVELDLATHTSFEGPMWFQRGCYVALAGTNPRGVVELPIENSRSGMPGPVYYSQAGIIDYGHVRRARANNI